MVENKTQKGNIKCDSRPTLGLQHGRQSGVAILRTRNGGKKIEQIRFQKQKMFHYA